MAELGAFLLPAVPLLALLVCLLFGRYPGCEAIIRLSERIASRAAHRLRCPPRLTSLRAPSFTPAGGLLIACSLSGRAPPA